MTNKVSIFFTSDGVEWAGYLQDKLSCKDCNINTELVNLSNKDIDFLSKVNVFLVSPDFLELKSWDILNKFDSKTAIAVLAGVDHNDWIEATGKHNIETVLEWLDYELEASDRSVRDLLVTIIGIYEIQEEFGDDPDADWNNYMNVPSDKPNEADSFYKVLPSRPCRPVNAVTNVFRKDDSVYLLLERMAEGKIEVLFHDDGRCINPAFEGNVSLYFFSWKGTSPDTFDVLVGGKEIGFGQIDALTDSSAIDRESAYDLPPPPARHSTFSSASSNTPKSVSYYYNEDNDFYDYPPQRRQDIPSSYSASSESSSVVSSAFSTDSEISSKAVKDYSPSKESKSNSDSLSKLEQIRKLLEDETDPVNILCSCLNIPNSVGALDEKLTSMIQPTESLKDAPFPTIALGKPEQSSAHWPTLVHFGAEFNLVKFCDSLLGCPLMYIACQTKNGDGHLPHDIAKEAGYNELAKALETFSRYLAQDQSGSHDSGISHCMRLSNASAKERTMCPPPPPRCSVDSQYMDMTGQAKPSNIERQQDMSLEIPSCRPPPPPVTTDGDKTPTSTLGDIFQGTVFSRKSAFDCQGMFYLDKAGEKSDSSSSDSKGTVKGDDSNSEEAAFNSHVNKSPSESEVGTTRDPRKSGGFSLGKLFRKKKERSYSEPGLHPEEEAVRRKQKTKIYRKGSEKTDSSTSGYSTYSESGRASDLKDEENEAHKNGKASKKKSKDRLKLLLNNVQRRNSVRIDHVLRDENIFAPVPLPGKGHDECF